MISPEQYSKTLSKTELIDIYLESCLVDIKKESISFEKTLEVSIKDRSTFTHDGDKVKVAHKFFLKATHPERRKEQLIKITATYCLIYSADSSFDDKFFKVFKDTTLPLNSWPYFREFAQSTTNRMSIPPIILPLIKR